MTINDYCTAAEMRAMLPNDSFSSTAPEYDTFMGTLATRASRAIDKSLGREPGAFYVSADTTRYFDGNGKTELYVGEIAAAPTSVSISTDGSVSSYTALDAADYYCYPYNALAMAEPYTVLVLDTVNGDYADWGSYRKGVQVVAKFGYSTSIPDIVKQATLIQALRWFKRSQQAYQDTGAVTELQQLKYVQKVDPDIGAVIEHLRRFAV